MPDVDRLGVPSSTRVESKGRCKMPAEAQGRHTMRLKLIVLGVTVASLAGASVMASKAVAEDSIYVPLFSYRTGPFANSGIPIANGFSDYIHMLNARDGGIGGVKLQDEEWATGYKNKKGG